MLIVFAGLPGTGKSSVSRELARRLDAVWLKIDSIEQAIRTSGVVPGSIYDAGYRAAYAVAGDNLRLGRDVIADSVNDWMLVATHGAMLVFGQACALWKSRRSVLTLKNIAGASRRVRAQCRALSCRLGRMSRSVTTTPGNATI